MLPNEGEGMCVGGSIRSVVAGALAAVLCGAPAAFAQSGASRPYRSLFGGATLDSKVRQRLDVSMSLAESYDDNLLADVAGGAAPPAFQTSGRFTGMTADVEFQSRGRRLQIGATAGSNLRYYGEVRELFATNHHVGAGFSAQLAKRTTLFVNQAFSYSPSYSPLYGLFANVATPSAGDVVPPATDYALSSAQSYVYATSASLTQGMTRHGSFVINSNARRSTFVGGGTGFPDSDSYDTGVHYVHGLGRNIGLRAGYTYTDTKYARTDPIVGHNVDLGLEYQHPWSGTRKTTLAVNVGSGVVKGPLQRTEHPDAVQQYQFWVADASLAHQLGRTWRARGTYRRGVQFIEGFSGPAFTDAMTVTTDGFLNRRTDLLGSVGYSVGQLALAGTPARFSTYTGDVRLRFAVSRTLASYVEYLYYFYDFNRSPGLPPGLPGNLTRNGVRVGLTLWVPVRHR